MSFYYNSPNLPNIVLISGWMVKKKDDILLIDGLKKMSNLLYIEIPILNTKLKNIDDCLLYSRGEIKKFFKKVDLEIGYSFGGKIISFLNDNCPKMLIAPSVFKNKSLKVAVKVFIFKILKKINKNFAKKNISFFASNDYVTATRNNKQLFLSVVNAYLKKKELKNIKNNVLIIAYKNDKSVKLQTLKKVHKYIENSKIIVRNFDHYGYFLDVSFILRKVQNFNGINF